MKKFLGIMIAGLVLFAAALVLFNKLHTSPGSRFLFSDGQATWVQAPYEFNNRAKEIEERATTFLKTFETDNDIREVSISLKVTGWAKLYLDGELLHEAGGPGDGIWKREATLSVPEIGRGAHQVSLKVFNDSGPRLMLVNADKINIESDHTWEAVNEDGSQQAVKTIADPIKMPAEIQGMSVREHVVSTLPVSISIFVLFVLLARNRKIVTLLNDPVRSEDYSSYFRFTCHALWLVLAVNCLSTPPDFGFDYQGHMAYIGYVFNNASLPLADQGWQMFQTPLYYIVSAIVFKTGQLFSLPYTPAEVLRVVPLACGFAQIEIGYRIMKAVFPKQAASQMVGLSIITFMPMHLYMSQQLGNEVFAAVFTSAAIFYVIKFINDPEKLLDQKEQLIFSVILSAAILSKISALLLIFPTVVCLAWLLSRNAYKPKAITLIGLKIFFFVLLFTGWYFIRNLLELGQPFVNGWSTSRGITWWQEPGFRTLGDLVAFGQALANPVLASVYGLWDSLYSTMWFDGLQSGLGIGQMPPWNYSFALPVAWFSILPSLAIFVGIYRSFRCKGTTLKPVLIYSVSCIAIYV
ncbi:MAG: glycosyltransferase family 39 protein, partial [Gammaproteobacteria bacterium]|nr:glycosyltransferase family 39 protein [Gammaproteobacteria bacterium]